MHIFPRSSIGWQEVIGMQHWAMARIRGNADAPALEGTVRLRRDPEVVETTSNHHLSGS